MEEWEHVVGWEVHLQHWGIWTVGVGEGDILELNKALQVRRSQHTTGWAARDPIQVLKYFL